MNHIYTLSDDEKREIAEIYNKVWKDIYIAESTGQEDRKEPIHWSEIEHFSVGTCHRGYKYICIQGKNGKEISDQESDVLEALLIHPKLGPVIKQCFVDTGIRV